MISTAQITLWLTLLLTCGFSQLEPATDGLPVNSAWSGQRTRSVGGTFAITARITKHTDKKVIFRIKEQGAWVHDWVFVINGNQLTLDHIDVIKGGAVLQNPQGRGTFKDGEISVNYSWRLWAKRVKNEGVQGVLTLKRSDDD